MLPGQIGSFAPSRITNDRLKTAHSLSKIVGSGQESTLLQGRLTAHDCWQGEGADQLAVVDKKLQKFNAGRKGHTKKGRNSAISQNLLFHRGVLKDGYEKGRLQRSHSSVRSYLQSF